MDATTKGVMVESFALERDGEFWIDLFVDRKAWKSIGPFATKAACSHAHQDFLAGLRQNGAVDLPREQ